MKKSLILFITLTFAFAGAAVAQSSKITPKSTTYKRSKPMTEYKKSFVVVRPRISGVPSSIARKIENAISYERVMNLNIKEEQTEIQWLEEATYEVGFNERGVLSIELTMVGTGAYPSGYSKNVVVDLKSGNVITPDDAFANLPGLAALVKKAQQEEIKETRITLKRDEPDFDGSEYFNKAKFTVKELAGFSVDKSGVTFRYDYGFPHVIQAMEPTGEYKYTWVQLRPFIKKGGPFGGFVN